MNKLKKILYLFIPVMVLFMGGGSAAYAASSTNYSINAEVIDGGGGSGSSSNYKIDQSIGQTSPVGTSSSSNYNVFAGYFHVAAVAEVTITVDFSSSTYSGTESGGAVTVTVNLSAASGNTVTVDYATSNGTATAGSDYTAANGTLSFNAGETSKTFTVTPIDDTIDENNETVTLTLSNTSNATLGTTNNPATLTITDDDAASAVDFSSSTATFGTTPTSNSSPTWTWASGGGTGTFRYKLDNSDLTSGATTTTSASFTPGSALAEGSHTLYVQELGIGGNWSASATFTIVIDAIIITVTDPIAPIDDLNLPYGEMTTNNSLDKKIVITNDGTANLIINNIAQSNPLSAPFSISADNCTNKTLPATGNCSLYVRFSPTAAGASSDSFDIPSNDSDKNPVTVNVSGTGITANNVPVITVTDSIAPKNDLSAPFGIVTVGSSSGSVVTVTNEGSTFLDIGIIGFNNPLSAPFRIVRDHCTEQSLGVAQSCMFTVIFSPTAAGTFSDSFEIPSNDPDKNSVTMSVSGTGTTDPVPDISVLPTEISIIVSVGTSSSAQSVTIMNIGTANLSISALTLTGTDASEFSIQNDNCSGQTIASSGDCTVDLIFSPTSSGEKSADLTIPSNDPDTPSAKISITGNPSFPKATATSSNATISYYAVENSIAGNPSTFTPLISISFTAINVVGSMDIKYAFSSLPQNPVIYKAIGNARKLIYPTNQCNGITNVTLNLSNKTLSFVIADNSECDQNATVGSIHDPIVLGQESGVAVSGSGGGGGGGSGGGGSGFFIAIAGFLLLVGGFCRKYRFRSPAEPQPK